jgi:hypothetical protein
MKLEVKVYPLRGNATIAYCGTTTLYPCLRQAGATRKILRRACPDENREDSVL